MAVFARAAEPESGSPSVPRFRRQLAAGVPARDGAFVRQHRSRGPQRVRYPQRGLHVLERTARQALRNREYLRQRLPPCDGRKQKSPWIARARQFLDGNFVSEPDLSGHARFVDSGEFTGQPSAAAAAECAAASREHDWAGYLDSSDFGPGPNDQPPSQSTL